MTKDELSAMAFQVFGPKFNEYRKCPGKQPEPEQKPTDNSQEERKEQE